MYTSMIKNYLHLSIKLLSPSLSICLMVEAIPIWLQMKSGEEGRVEELGTPGTGLLPCIVYLCLWWLSWTCLIYMLLLFHDGVLLGLPAYQFTKSFHAKLRQATQVALYFYGLVA